MKVMPAKAKQPSIAPVKAAQKAAKAVSKAPVPKASAKKTMPAKPAAKPAVQAPKAKAQPSVRPVAKAAGASAKPPSGPERKPPAKPTPPSPAQPVVKPSGGNSKVSVKPKVGDKTESNVQAKAPLRPEPTPVPVAAPAASVASSVVQRPGRPSSRLASLTVPSMAQSVASTAAKASYSQLTSAPLIVPPLPSATKKDPKLANNWKTKPVEQLTDAELMAMPDSEYMNDKQMGAFRLKLALLKQEILNSAGETTEHLREDTVVVPDPADRATIEEEHALELRTRDRERKLLKKIEQSIGRIDAGDYGYCDETGEPIGVGRLLARPTATLSLEAQQRRELKQKMFGD